MFVIPELIEIPEPPALAPLPPIIVLLYMFAVSEVEILSPALPVPPIIVLLHIFAVPFVIITPTLLFPFILQL